MLKTRSARKRLKNYANHIVNATVRNPWELELIEIGRELSELLKEKEQGHREQRRLDREAQRRQRRSKLSQLPER